MICVIYDRFELNPDLSLGFSSDITNGQLKSFVLDHSPSNQLRRFIANDNFKIRALPFCVMYDPIANTL